MDHMAGLGCAGSFCPPTASSTAVPPRRSRGRFPPVLSQLPP